MGLFNNIKNLFNFSSMPSHSEVLDKLNHIDFFSFSGNDISPAFTINLDSYSGIDEAYYKCSPLSTVIGRNAMAMANAKWWITDKKDNDKSDKYKNISKLLKNPNPLQSWSELVIQMHTYLQCYGHVFLFAPVPNGYSIQEASAIWVIKPSYIDIEESKKLYFQSEIDDIILKYYLNIGGTRTELPNNQVLHIKDSYQNLNFSPTDLKGKSRIIGLEDAIKNIIQANEAIYSLNKDRGAQGILANTGTDAIGPVAITEEEKKSIQDQYLSKYGLRRNQSKVIITEAALKWQQMSFNVKDLMLFEGKKENVQEICDVFMYPFELLGNTQGVTYANKKEAKSWHYNDNIIPMSILYSQKLSGFFELDKDHIYADFSHIEVLKESETEKADALGKKISALTKAYHDKVISLEEYRLAIDYDENINGNTMYDGNEGQNTAQSGQDANNQSQGTA